MCLKRSEWALDMRTRCVPAEHSVCECVRRLVSSVSALAKGQRVRACVRACVLPELPGLSASGPFARSD